MSLKNNLETFFFISKDKLAFSVYEDKDKPIFKKNEIISNNHLNDEYIYKFLDRLIFDLEKKNKSFITNINLIFSDTEFLEINLSIKDIRNNKVFTEKDVEYLILDLKKQIQENNPDQYITFININNFVINGQRYEDFRSIIDVSDFCIETTFFLIPNQFRNNYKKLLSKFDISLNRIYSLHNLNVKNDLDTTDECLEASKIFYYRNYNEVIIKSKKSTNSGYFERFFNLFT